jgi:hypothetical protein
MQMRRFTGLTNAFSKKAENHYDMVCLYTAWYNFAKMRKTLRCSPAMSAGLSAWLWHMTDIVALIDAAARAAKPRAPYKAKARLTAAQAENSN